MNGRINVLLDTNVIIGLLKANLGAVALLRDWGLSLTQLVLIDEKVPMAGTGLFYNAKSFRKQINHTMASITHSQPTVIRTSRGLSVAGTRITLYSIMDYLKAGWPSQLIRDRLNLTDQQVTAVMDFIQAHQEEIEAEYTLVLQQAKENQRYWQARNQETFARLAAKGSPPGKEAIWFQVQAKKKQLGLS